MRFIMAFLASVLTTVVFSLVLAFVSRTTLFDPNYLVSKVHDTEVYTVIQDLLLDAALSNAPDPEAKQALRQALDKVVTPRYIQSKIESIAPQIDARLKGGDIIPKVDLSDFDDQAKAAGYPVDASNINQSVALPEKLDSQIVTAYRLSNNILYLGILGSLIIVVVIFLWSIRFREYRTLIYFFVATAVWLGLTGVGMIYVPELVTNTFLLPNQAGTTTKALAPIVSSVSRDMGVQILYTGLCFLFVGLAVFGISRISKAKTITAKQGSSIN